MGFWNNTRKSRPWKYELNLKFLKLIIFLRLFNFKNFFSASKLAPSGRTSLIPFEPYFKLSYLKKNINRCEATKQNREGENILEKFIGKILTYFEIISWFSLLGKGSNKKFHNFEENYLYYDYVTKDTEMMPASELLLHIYGDRFLFGVGPGPPTTMPLLRAIRLHESFTVETDTVFTRLVVARE